MTSNRLCADHIVTVVPLSQDSRGVSISVRVDLIEVHSEESVARGGCCTDHHEVVVSVPAIIAAFRAQQGSESSSALDEGSKMLEAMIEFCQQLQSLLPM